MSSILELCEENNRLAKASTPSHYAKAIQPIDYIEANGLDFAEGNVVKYVTRYKDKGGVDDLRKAMYYLELLIKRNEK